MRSIRGHTVVMTGASGGIGKNSAELLARQGANLALCARREGPLRMLAQQLEAAHGITAFWKSVDVAKESQLAQFMEEAAARFGRLDALLNFAGLSITCDIASMTEENYDHVMDVNLKGTYMATKHFLGHVDPAAGGMIINIGSLAGRRGNPRAAHYSAAKAGIINLSECMALQFKARNIRVTVINPGPVDTDFFLGRMPAGAKPEDFLTGRQVAEVIEFVMTRDENVLLHDVAMDGFRYFKSR